MICAWSREHKLNFRSTPNPQIPQISSPNSRNNQSISWLLVYFITSIYSRKLLLSGFNIWATNNAHVDASIDALTNEFALRLVLVLFQHIHFKMYSLIHGVTTIDDCFLSSTCTYDDCFLTVISYVLYHMRSLNFFWGMIAVNPILQYWYISARCIQQTVFF